MLVYHRSERCSAPTATVLYQPEAQSLNCSSTCSSRPSRANPGMLVCHRSELCFALNAATALYHPERNAATAPNAAPLQTLLVTVQARTRRLRAHACRQYSTRNLYHPAAKSRFPLPHSESCSARNAATVLYHPECNAATALNAASL